MLKTYTMCLFAAAAWLLVLSACAAYSGEEAARQAAMARIEVSYKLDPRITRGMYMGDRWVSPPSFTMVGDNGKLVVEARAQALDAGGRPIDASLEWTASNPDMVKVEPATGKQVSLEILKEGGSYLTVRCGVVSQKLSVTTTREDGELQVEISR